MAGGMKTLAKETAIYGVSSILGRFLNWLLTPFWTYVLMNTAQMGVVGNLYSWTALTVVILTYGMETGLFRFANKSDEDPLKVYTTTLISIAFTTFLFILLAILFLNPITTIFGSEAIKPHYVLLLIIILGLDTLSAIPFAFLRYQKRPILFATIQVLNVLITIAFNLFFFLACPWLAVKFPGAFFWFDIGKGVDYILISNLMASFIRLLLLSPQLRVKYTFDGVLLKKMLVYSLPLLVLGVAGIMNQNLDKMLYPHLSTEVDKMGQLGIYTASFKVAVIMVMFTQAFRYAFEPFIFAKNKESGDNKLAYSQATKYFIIFGLFIFLAVMGYLDIVKYLLEVNYQEGLAIVPIVMAAELFFGIYFNLSLWYKLTDQTRWGAYLSLIGLVVTVLGNILFVPEYGYMACAWTAFFANLVMMVVSYFLGQKNYPIQYDLKSAGFYVVIAAFLFAGIMFTHGNIGYAGLRLLVNTVLIGIYLLIVLKKDLPLQQIPIINKYFRK
ncbi:oligosaccharide flippase family protein [Petrimonas sulfuriphila]|uniref:oligosaccharide flippase family protein n=1 Tax=Petrimonas TaxID=307628 RepID=UPI002B3C6CA5|nr:lipopolysaccharide biosynthesis protein [Petrimonas sp.]